MLITSQRIAFSFFIDRLDSELVIALILEAFDFENGSAKRNSAYFNEFAFLINVLRFNNVVGNRFSTVIIWRLPINSSSISINIRDI
jgi:hypothetical protein